MSQALFFVLLLALLLVAGFFIGRYSQKNSGGLERAHQAKREQKEKAKTQIMALFERQEKITNDQVQELLSVSDATATNYLDELEKEGKIRQNGSTGKWVYYSRFNG